jgi:hypothetical protein
MKKVNFTGIEINRPVQSISQLYELTWFEGSCLQAFEKIAHTMIETIR